MTTRRLIAITLGWSVFAVGISTGLMAVIALWLKHIDADAPPEAIWAIVGAGLMLLILLGPLWLLVRYEPTGHRQSRPATISQGQPITGDSDAGRITVETQCPQCGGIELHMSDCDTPSRVDGREWIRRQLRQESTPLRNPANFGLWFSPWFVVTAGFGWLVSVTDDWLSATVLLGILAIGSIFYWLRYWQDGGSPFRDDKS